MTEAEISNLGVGQAGSPPQPRMSAIAGIDGIDGIAAAVAGACLILMLPTPEGLLITFGKSYYKMFDVFLPGVVLSIVWVFLMTALLILIGPTL